MDDKQKEKIIKLRAKGKGYKTISNILGINVNTIKSFCKRKNINAETASKLLERIPIETTFCDNCGREIKQMPKQKKKRFCSDECRIQWWNSHLDQVKRKAYYTFRCVHCGKVFQVYGDSRRRYCSHDCYIAARFKGCDEKHTTHSNTPIVESCSKLTSTGAEITPASVVTSLPVSKEVDEKHTTDSNASIAESCSKLTSTGAVIAQASVATSPPVSKEADEKHTTDSNASIAAECSSFTEKVAESIADTSATSLPVLKGVYVMTKEQFHNERMYQTTMHIVRQILKNGIINKEEYNQISEIFLKKYNPVFGRIFSDLYDLYYKD